MTVIKQDVKTVSIKARQDGVQPVEEADAMINLRRTLIDVKSV